jgi:hypothetical protein
MAPASEWPSGVTQGGTTTTTVYVGGVEEVASSGSTTTTTTYYTATGKRMGAALLKGLRGRGC